jgi:hypothetical protein
MTIAEIYSSREGLAYAAVYLPWHRVREILGRDHDGSPEDDRALVRHLAGEDDAPAWLEDADRQGWTDEEGWGLIGPELSEATPEDAARHELAACVDRETMTIAEIYDLCDERGVSPTDFWVHAMGGDRADLPREDVDRCMREVWGILDSLADDARERLQISGEWDPASEV